MVDPLPKAARDLQGTTAGFVTRAVSVLIDIALVSVLVVVGWAGTRFLIFVLRPTEPLPTPDAFALLVFGYAFMVLYWMACWATTGRSLGGFAMGVRVRSRDGSRVGWLRSLGRAVFCVAVPPGLLWAIISHRDQSIQDIVLRTTVIRDWARLGQ
ncbi:MAG: RDD family protein [Actinobacteria bacterium]|nr:RDD family protein [Actinomycetota bacterium]